MSGEITLRLCTSVDLEAVLKIYPLSFPDEDLVPLVKSLMGREDVFSFVAVKDTQIVGHIVFTVCALESGKQQCVLLGPLAVHPNFMRRGIGANLIRMGIDQARSQAFAAVFVLGDPAYYERFGFEVEENVQTPYPLPPEWAQAWRSIWIMRAASGDSDVLNVPEPWQRSALWH